MCLGDPRTFAKAHCITVAQARRLECTAEHLQARQDGGTSARSNIVAACLDCNQQRHRRKRPLEPGAHGQWVTKRIREGRWHRAWLGAVGETLTPSAHEPRVKRAQQASSVG